MCLWSHASDAVRVGVNYVLADYFEERSSGIRVSCGQLCTLFILKHTGCFRVLLARQGSGLVTGLPLLTPRALRVALRPVPRSPPSHLWEAVQRRRRGGVSRLR